MVDDDEKDGGSLQSVVLTMQVLEQVVRTPKGVGVTSLAKTLGTSKSRIHRHLQTLVRQGYVFQHEDSERYEVGHKLVSLVQSVSDNSGMVHAAYDPLLELRDALGHSAVASQLTPEGMLVIATVPGRSPIEIGVRVGSLLSFHSSAQGKVAAAFSSEAFQSRVLAGQLEAFTPSTIIEPAVLKKEFAEIRRRGWAVAPHETALGLNTLASPVFDASGMVCGATGIVDMVQSVGEVPTGEQIARTIKAARKISERLGYQVKH